MGDWSLDARTFYPGGLPVTGAIVASMSVGNGQSIPNNADTKVAFSTSDFTTGPTVDLTNERITITVAGYYRVSARAQLVAGAAGSGFGFVFYKNGVVLSGGVFGAQTGSGYVEVSSSKILSLAVGDYVEVYVKQITGGAQTLNSADLQVELIR